MPVAKTRNKATRKRKLAAPKRPRGRPSKFDCEMADRLLEHFEEKLRNTNGKTIHFLKETKIELPTFGTFAREVGVTSRTISNWGEKNDEFRDAMDSCNEVQAEMLESLALSGVWNPSMAQFSLKYRQKWEDKITIDSNTSITLYFDAQDEKA